MILNRLTHNVSSKKENRLYKILSIDGGGVRALIPAMVIKELEHRCHRPISQSFDFVAGTSIGMTVQLVNHLCARWSAGTFSHSTSFF